MVVGAAGRSFGGGLYGDVIFEKVGWGGDGMPEEEGEVSGESRNRRQKHNSF